MYIDFWIMDDRGSGASGNQHIDVCIGWRWFVHVHCFMPFKADAIVMLGIYCDEGAFMTRTGQFIWLQWASAEDLLVDQPRGAEQISKLLTSSGWRGYILRHAIRTLTEEYVISVQGILLAMVYLCFPLGQNGPTLSIILLGASLLFIAFKLDSTT